MIEEKRFEQIFLTDARKERTENIIQDLSIESKIFTLSENQITTSI